MGNLKREYLTSEEKNFYMVIKSFIQYVEGIRSLDKPTNKMMWDNWKDRGMLTGSMQKDLKLAYTYLRKFCIELEGNLNKNENERLRKQLEKFDYKLVDDYTVKKLIRNAADSIKYAVMERDKFVDILEDITAVRCVGCTEDYTKCPLYKSMDDISIMRVNEEPTCPYACNLKDYSEEELKNIERLKSIVNGRGSVTKEFHKKG